MNRWTLMLISIVLCAQVSANAVASSSQSVGLGVSIGVAFPEGELDKDFSVNDWDAEFNWGFYVNIPLIYTFHITPSAELYKIGNQHATDLSLAFKFIINVWQLDIYAGVVPGITAMNDINAINVGALGGVAFNLFSNLNLFVQLKYKVVLHGDQNSKVLHANTGILFNF